MPYTQEELQDVDFYREFIDKKRHEYLDRLSKSAANGFMRNNGTLVSFEAIDNGLGIEDANLESDEYRTFVSALSGPEGVKLLNILNEVFNDYMEGIVNHPGSGGSTQGASAASISQAFGTGQTPKLYNTSDVPTYIRELAQGKPYNKQSPEYIKTSNLEKIIDRSISELSETAFAESLPDGIENGDVITNEFADDNRKWLIQNNQKRIFPDLATFYGTVMDWGNIKTLTMEQLRTIPDGEPVE